MEKSIGLKNGLKLPRQTCFSFNNVKMAFYPFHFPPKIENIFGTIINTTS